ncbi:hypothetical protein CC86DRAFT_459083 [Ophiobolus disseminans]|uniref:F-box domain-containing protein n=1 Tax=Ophiobolus disseminans TaxID=1469910 RepID=A0A6A6ZMH4_9PLEO|nr:hypothetical protein CC86DRAFT_459083 [Ophiobolus disseminans]
MARLHLLGLPRELRDIIYNYLDQDLRWKDNDKYPHVQNAPLLSVLLVHSQIHDEYLHARCFRAPVVEIHILDLYHIRSYQKETQLAQKIRNLMRYARDLTLFVNFEHRMTIFRQPVWPAINHMVKLFTSKARYIGHLRIHVLMPFGYSIGHDELSTSHFQQSVNFSLGDLPLVQRGEGYRLANDGGAHQESSGFPNFYAMIRTRFTICSRGLLQLLPEEEREVVAAWPRQIQGWKEKQGDKLECW